MQSAGGAGVSAGGLGGTAPNGGQSGITGGAAGIAGVAGAVTENPDEALVWPASISVMGLPGGHGILEMFALTVRKGATNTEMYAALKNVGDRPVCDGALTIELYDKDGQSVASGIGGLLTDHVYRLTDGSGSVAACVGAGEVTMASMTDLSPDLDLDNLGFAVYRNPYFGIDVDQIGSFAISDVVATPGDAGTSYTGKWSNDIDITVENPAVMIFPVNSVGRPLGMATASDTVRLEPGDSFTFTTTPDVAGMGFHAYATAKTSQMPDAGAGGQGGQGGQGGEAGR